MVVLTIYELTKELMVTVTRMLAVDQKFVTEEDNFWSVVTSP